MPMDDNDNVFEPYDPNEEDTGGDPGDETDALNTDQRKEVNSWINTFREEWQTGQEATDAQLPSSIRDSLKGLVEDSIIAVRQTIKYSKSETLKFKAATWLLDSLLSDKGNLRVDDPIYQMIEEMKKVKSENAKHD